MRLLLDENLPKRLKSDFADHEIYTVRDKGWNGIKNGQLLQLLVENSFDSFLTFDKLTASAKFSEIHDCCFRSFSIQQYLS